MKPAQIATLTAIKQIPGPAGLLELAISAPHNQSPTNSPRALALICHPHPLHGGTMHNKVVTTLERSFRELDCLCVRFNFRGVGQSGGVYANGIGESEDLAAVLAFVQAELGEDSQGLPLWLAGFSFGSFVSARMANALRAQRLLSIAPPVQSWDFMAIDPPTMAWTIIQGDADEVVEAQAVYDFAKQFQPPPQLIKMSATHFFHGVLTELRAHVNAAFA
jgi:uncharacterized protein